MHLHSYLDQFPLIGIFRGLKPDEALAVAEPVLEAGFQILEIPMNSPQPLQSIELLAKRFPDQIVGGGTVMSPDDVKRIAAVGGRLIFMPHSDPAVIRQAKLSGLLCIAGVATPTEAFAALANGADALKLYPAEQLAPVVVKAWRAVVPSQHRLLPVGGITPQSMKPYLLAGANGFGLGSALYKAGMTPGTVKANAIAFRDEVRRLTDEGLFKA